jgi:hypothetical protein
MPLPERRLREVRHGRAMLPVLNDRKPNASPERVAEIKAKRAQRFAGATASMPAASRSEVRSATGAPPATSGEAVSLFAQTFGNPAA